MAFTALRRLPEERGVKRCLARCKVLKKFCKRET